MTYLRNFKTTRQNVLKSEDRTKKKRKIRRKNTKKVYISCKIRGKTMPQNCKDFDK